VQPRAQVPDQRRLSLGGGRARKGDADERIGGRDRPRGDPRIVEEQLGARRHGAEAGEAQRRGASELANPRELALSHPDPPGAKPGRVGRHRQPPPPAAWRAGATPRGIAGYMPATLLSTWPATPLSPALSPVSAGVASSSAGSAAGAGVLATLSIALASLPISSIIRLLSSSL